MRVTVDEHSVHIALAWWEKALGLMRDVSVAREDISDVQVLQEPVREAMATGMKVGLRLPWLMYVARTLRLDQMFIVRREVPALSFKVRNHGALRRVLLSTPQAQELALELSAAGRG